MAGLHDPRTDEHRHINARWLVVEQSPVATARLVCAEKRGRCLAPNQQHYPRVIGEEFALFSEVHDILFGRTLVHAATQNSLAREARGASGGRTPSGGTRGLHLETSLSASRPVYEVILQIEKNLCFLIFFLCLVKQI